ncbi:alpha/beta hydrolase fold domain-containing protein [Lysobacter sp. F6437]|uniref:alpha/beta hydrolase fold domain-containing protein n=1 Tax=Lysobacter sp. F6437 TaxID=3459296 RepID=UPI00403D8C4C
MPNPLPHPVLLVRAVALAAMLLVGSGCQRVLFGFLNRGLAPPEATVVFSPARGLSLDIYRPQPMPATAAPVVVFFYGGSWQRGKREQYRFVGRRLAANGILTIVADYRTWPRAGFPDFIDDAAQAVAWARDNAASRGGDPDRLFVAGHSAGAHIAALLATDGRYLRRHGIAPTNLAGVVGLSGPYDFVIDGDLEPVFGPRTQWPQAQPVNFVSGDEPPFLLVHGLDDDVVESRDSIELADKLRANGVNAHLLLLPDGTHGTPLAGFYDPARAPCLLPAVLAFVHSKPSVDEGGCEQPPDPEQGV